jgi:diguanylate cyclase (GGDEF)-like protein
MRAPDLGTDEIGRLGRSVNQMLDSLESSSRQLETTNIQLTAERRLVEELNHTLEAKVAERTSDLMAANDELRERNRQLVEARVQAATDGLTGLGNHRSFHDALRTAVSDATRKDALAVFMVDIDNFKLINDELGHQAGDRILAEVANTIREAIADGGAVFRYGGDEFAALAGVASLTEARLLGDKLRRDVISRFQESGVSISIGIALHNDAALSAEEVIYRADSAMYTAKSAGKNCVHVWTPQETAQLTR